MSKSDIKHISIRTHAPYLRNVFEHFDMRVAKCVEELKSHLNEFDTLVASGLSGTLLILPVATALGVHAAVVRKDNDGAHSSYGVEGTLGARYVILDDQVSTGATVRFMRRKIGKHWAEHVWERKGEQPPEFVACYQYLWSTCENGYPCWMSREFNREKFDIEEVPYSSLHNLPRIQIRNADTLTARDKLEVFLPARYGKTESEPEFLHD